MKIIAVDLAQKGIKNVSSVAKKIKTTDLKPIKTYAQYMRAYGLK